MWCGEVKAAETRLWRLVDCGANAALDFRGGPDDNASTPSEQNPGHGAHGLHVGSMLPAGLIPAPTAAVLREVPERSERSEWSAPNAMRRGDDVRALQKAPRLEVGGKGRSGKHA
jgi:hypothetical protein